MGKLCVRRKPRSEGKCAVRCFQITGLLLNSILTQYNGRLTRVAPRTLVFFSVLAVGASR